MSTSLSALRVSLLASILLSAGAAAARAADFKLEPNAILRIAMPELPPTLHRMATNEPDSVPRATVQLPSNYSPDRKFPLFVFLHGGNGGPGLSLGPCQRATGGKDAILVNLSLFKKEWNPKGPARGLAILPDDYETQRLAYAALLQKVFDAVPNITREGSTFGGFSNGAHTTGVMLSNADPFLLRHFENFYMIEGGSRQLTLEVLRRPEFKDVRLISMMGDRGRPATQPTTVATTGPTTRAGNWPSGVATLAEQAREAGVDYTYVAMRGYGHEMPDDYLRLVNAWSRREPLVLPPPKPATQPATTGPATQSDYNPGAPAR